jgi:hypothetical protein
MKRLHVLEVVKRIIRILPLTAGVFLVISLPTLAYAQSPDEGFSLQVTPSPLIATVKPGMSTTLEMSIRNTNTSSQKLKMGLKTFSVDEKSGQVALGNTEPSDVKDFVHFAAPTFSVEAGAIFNQKIYVNTPKNAGFTYSFAITISRDDGIQPNIGSGAKIRGTVAVLTLLNVDHPGSQRKFELSDFTVSRHVYEFLPAAFTIKLKNTGNTLVQPKGNLYIQRGSNDQNPLMVMPLNPTDGYILPGSSRTFSTTWQDGFPRFEEVGTGTTGSKKHLVWDWGNLSKLRIGKYTAKVVAVYDDGQRDVPVTAEVSFWVMPWRIILGVFLILTLLLVGFFTIIRKTTRLARNVRHKQPKAKTKDDIAPQG